MHELKKQGEILKMKIISLDVDGVVADIHTPWLAYYNEKYNENLKFEDITDWDFSKFVKNADCLYEYLKLPNVYRTIPVIEGSVDVLRELSKDFKLQFVTCTPTYAMIDRLYWLREHFPFIDCIHFTEDKSSVVADILVEDKAEALEKFDGIRVCVDAPYNRKLKVPHYRIKSIKELKDLVYML